MKHVIRMKIPKVVEQATDDASYVGAFENEHGELLIYTHDDSGSRLWHSDYDWKACSVGRNGSVLMMLDTDEAMWVRACWNATHVAEQIAEQYGAKA